MIQQQQVPRMALPARIVLAALLIALPGCRGDKGDSADTEGDNRAGSALVELIAPRMERLNPGVEDQVIRVQEHVRRLAADPGTDPRSLGESFSQLARLYHAYGLFEAAVPAYKNAETLLPDEYAWPYYLGRVYLSLAALDRAEEAFRRALRSRPDDAPTRIALARIQRKLRRFDDAAVELQYVLERNPDSAGALLLTAALATDRGNMEEAAKSFERLLQLQPGATALHQPLAKVYRSLGRAEEASALLERAGSVPVKEDDPLMRELKIQESGGQLDLLRGVEAYKRGDFQAAVDAFRRVIAAQPEGVDGHLNLGSALVRLGQFEAATEQYRVVLELDPNNALAYFNLGVIHARREDDAAAIRHYNEALRFDPDYRDPRFNLANLLRRTGRCSEALDHYGKLIQLDPKFAPARISNAICLTQLGRYELAKQDLEQSLAVLPADPSLTQMLVRILAASPEDRLRDGARALELATVTVAVERTVTTLEGLAMAQAESGRFDEAVRTQTEALSATGTAPAIVARLQANLERYRQGRPCRDPGL